MLVIKLVRRVSVCIVALHMSLVGRDMIVEFKGAYFHPTGSCFKAIYGKSAALFGPEITVALSDCGNWYGFASVDYLKRSGCSIGLLNATHVRLVPLAFGLKYLKPLRCADVYAGLGFQPTHLRTKNCSPYVTQDASQWCLGGIAKLGAYIDLPCCMVLDLFLDYSFVKAGCPNLCQPTGGAVYPVKANVSGVIFGAGIGYRFD